MCNCSLRGIAYPLLVAAILAFMSPANVFAQQNSSSVEPIQTETLEERNLREFREWRANIPDLEKRVYDRLKKINNRTLDATRLLVAALVFNILALVLFSVVLYRRRSPAIGPDLSDTTYNAAEPEPPQTSDTRMSDGDKTTTDPKPGYLELSALQSRIHNALIDLEQEYALIREDDEQAEEFRALYDKRMRKIEQTLNDWTRRYPDGG